MTFISGRKIRSAIERMVRRASAVDFAVAYWGTGAGAKLGLDRSAATLRILCDLSSGACNPNELTELLKRPSTQIRTKDGLHAKVYLSSSVAIVGSANASANGLGEEAEEIDEELEAAVLLKDNDAIEAAREWFERHWSNADEVNTTLIDAAREKWQSRRNAPPVRDVSVTLLSKFDTDPQWFRDRQIRLVAYDLEDPSDEAKEVYRKHSTEKHLYSKAEMEKYEKSGLPFYEDWTGWPLKQGEFVIDFSKSDTSKQAYVGLWRVRQGDYWQARIRRKHRIVFLDEVQQAFGLSFPAKEKRELKKRIVAFLDREKPQPDKHGNLVDMPLNKAAPELAVPQERSTRG